MTEIIVKPNTAVSFFQFDRSNVGIAELGDLVDVLPAAVTHDLALLSSWAGVCLGAVDETVKL